MKTKPEPGTRVHVVVAGGPSECVTVIACDCGLCNSARLDTRDRFVAVNQLSQFHVEGEDAKWRHVHIANLRPCHNRRPSLPT